MKIIKRLLVLALAIALIVSCFAVSTSAGDVPSAMLYMKSYGPCIMLNDSAKGNVSKVEFDGVELTLNTDYTVDQTKNLESDTVILFTDSFMEKTLMDDVEDAEITVYMGATPVEVNKGVFYDDDYTYSLYYFTRTREDFDEHHQKGLLELFVKKGILTKSVSGDTTIYKDGDTELYYVDDEYASPAKINMYSHVYSTKLTIADAYYLLQNSEYYYDVGEIEIAIGKIAAIDLSDYEPGVKTKFGKTRVEINTSAEMFYILTEAGLINMDYTALNQNHNTDVYNKNNKKLLNVAYDENDEEVVYMTVANDATAEDYLYFEVTSEMDSDILEGEVLVVMLILADPEIKSGDNQTYDKAKGGNLVVSSTAPFEDFQKVLVDDKEISKDNYTAVAGSTVITLKEAYLNTLSAGTHTLSIVSKTGTATATFTVVEAKKAEEVANTADNNMIGALIALSTLSALGFVSLKKKEN